jgi:Lrp/AsnC family transcriptional regulator, leucine-responsive regulatory protein
MYGIMWFMPKIIKEKTVSTEATSKLLDSIGWNILRELQRNARIPFAELGRRVGLSTPAVMERIHRMEDADIITGYRADLNYEKIGYRILAFIRVSVVGDFMPRIMRVAQEEQEVIECHRVTGSDSFIMKVAVGSVDELQTLIDRMTPYVATTTSIALSAIVTGRIIEPKQSGRIAKK